MRILIKFILIINSLVNCEWCHDRCRAPNDPGELDIYFKYTKAEFNVSTLPQQTEKSGTARTIQVRPGLYQHISRAKRLVGEEKYRKHLVKPTPQRGNNVTVQKCSSQIGKKTACKPRQTIIEVVSNTGLLQPNLVFTKFCGGFCAKDRKCRAKITGEKTHKVQWQFPNGTVYCATIKVPKDISCDCSCTWTSCPMNQLFNNSTCSCECNAQLRLTCQQKNRIFNKETCACECKKRVHKCTSTSRWNEEHCRCQPDIG